MEAGLGGMYAGRDREGVASGSVEKGSVRVHVCRYVSLVLEAGGVEVYTFMSGLRGIKTRARGIRSAAVYVYLDTRLCSRLSFETTIWC